MFTITKITIKNLPSISHGCHNAGEVNLVRWRWSGVVCISIKDADQWRKYLLWSTKKVDRAENAYCIIGQGVTVSDYPPVQVTPGGNLKLVSSYPL